MVSPTTLGPMLKLRGLGRLAEKHWVAERLGKTASVSSDHALQI